MSIRRYAPLVLVVVLGASCAPRLTPPPASPAPPVTATAPMPEAPLLETTASPEAPAAPASAAPTTVIDFESDTGGALPDGPEMDVVDAKPKVRFNSLISDKYRRDGGAPPAAAQ